MKILNVSSSGGIGGREMLVMTLSRGLRMKGCDVRLLTAPRTWLSGQTRDAGFHAYTLPMKKYVDLYSMWRIGKIVRAFEPDVVHLYFIPDIWLVVPAVRLWRPAAKIFLLRSMQSAPMKDWYRTRLFRSLDKVVTMSEFLRRDFLSQTRLPQDRVETIYVGVDLGAFDALPEGGNVLRRDYGLKPDDILIGLVGRIDAGKGQDTFIEAARHALDTVGRKSPAEAARMRFFIVGSSEKGSGPAYESGLKRRVRDLGLQERFVFTGFRGDVPQVMQALDIAVFPSKGEAFGLVVIEAMAASKAVVGCDRGAFPEIIKDGENGLVVACDAPSLGRGIVELVLDGDKRRAFGQRGRATVEQTFNLEQTLEKFLQLYRGSGR